MIWLGILATILWLNIPGIGGTIAGCTVIAIILFYPFIAFNPLSKFNIWLNRMIRKINYKSYIWNNNRRAKNTTKASDQKHSRLVKTIIILSAGLLQYYIFWLLYDYAGFHILACICALIGDTLLFGGLILLYLRSRTENGAKWFIILVSSIGYFTWQYVYHGWKLYSHIFAV